MKEEFGYACTFLIAGHKDGWSMGFEVDLAIADAGSMTVGQHQEYTGDIRVALLSMGGGIMMNQFENGYSIVAGTAPPTYSSNTLHAYYGLSNVGFYINARVRSASGDLAVSSMWQFFRFQWDDEYKSEGRQYQVGDT